MIINLCEFIGIWFAFSCLLVCLCRLVNWVFLGEMVNWVSNDLRHGEI